MKRARGQPDDPFGLNPAQKRAAYDLAHHILLGSGAGCGKTRVLVARVIRFLCAPDARVSQVAAITFTEKAAGEMVTRLRAACRRQMERSASDADRRRWRTHLRDLEGARISTIHAFCGRLLREFAAEAGVDPRFAVLDELPASLKRQEAVAETTAAALSADEEGARLVAATFGLDRMRDLLADLLRRRAALRRAVGEAVTPPSLLERWRTAVMGSPALRHHREALQAVEPLADDDRLALQRQRALDLLAAAEAEDDPALALGILHELGSAIDRHGGSARKWPGGEALARIRAALEGLQVLFKQGSLKIRRDAAAACERRAAAVLAAVWGLFERCEAAYAAAKRTRGELDFDDLLIVARDLLKESPEARRRIRLSLRHLLVDELQDTDFLQLEILRLIVGEEGTGRPAAAVQAGGPVLFAVGDPKQSIYRFRGAEVEVFAALADMVAQWNPEGVQELDTSYRTHARGVAFQNAFFARLFGVDGERRDYEVAYQTIRSGVEEAGPDRPIVSLLAQPAEGENAAAARRREADQLAQFIRHMVEVERPQVRDDRQGRPVRYGDIALLFRSFRDVGVYERAFEETGVPFYTVSARQFFGRREVKDMLLALKVIDNADDEVSLIGLLRSPLVGVSDETLYRMRLAGGSVSAALVAPERVADVPDDERAALVRAGALLAGLRAVKDRLTVAALIERLLAGTGCDAGALALFAGRRRLANLRRLVDLAGELEGTGTLAQVIQRLDDLVTTQEPGAEVAAVEEADDVVRLMTVHAAKGLEFPVVVLPDMGRTLPAGGAPVSIGRAVGLACAVETPQGASFTPAALALARQESADRETAEEKRTLYVAATRARDRLVVSGVRPAHSGTGPWFVWFQAHAADLDVDHEAACPDGKSGDRRPGLGSSVCPGRSCPAGFFRDSRPARPDETGRGALRPMLSPDFPPTMDAFLERGRVKWEAVERAADHPGEKAAEAALARRVAPLDGPWTHRRWFGAREFTDYERCPHAWRLRHVEGFPDPLPEFEGVLAPQRGRAAHAALERVDFARGAAGIGEAVDFALAQTGPLPDREADALRRWTRRLLERFVESPLAGHLRTARRLERELPFTLRCGSAYVQGRIDVLWQDGAERWHLVDYKADRVTAETAPAHAAAARLQVLVYALAARAMTGAAPADAALLYVSPDPAVTQMVSLDAPALAAAEATIEAVVAHIRAGEFPHRRHAGCAHCPYEHLCGAEASENPPAR